MRFHDQYAFLDRRLKEDRRKHEVVMQGGWDCDCSRGTFFKSRVYGYPTNRGVLGRFRALERNEVRLERKRDRRNARLEARLELD